ncbi:MAG: ferredoxin family protein [Chloroflexi bacterium]|nr:ferredoxin family protein [Chloroflexota bacterium]
MITKYIEINTRLCEACWKCVEICPNGVLGKIDFFGHHHVKIEHAEACKGCKKCVRACPNEAIFYLGKPGSLEVKREKAVNLRL